MRILREKAAASRQNAEGTQPGRLFDQEADRRYGLEMARRYAVTCGAMVLMAVSLVMGVVAMPAGSYASDLPARPEEAAEAQPLADDQAGDGSDLTSRVGTITENLSFLPGAATIDQGPAILSGVDAMLAGLSETDEMYGSIDELLARGVFDDSGTGGPDGTYVPEDGTAEGMDAEASEETEAPVSADGVAVQAVAPEGPGDAAAGQEVPAAAPVQEEAHAAPASVPVYIGDAAAASDRVAAMKQEYAVAGQVYEYLSGQGFSDVAIAGVLGNMMTECGGQTLALDPYAWAQEDSGTWYYGLCQWSMAYNQSVSDADVPAQLDYLMGNLAKNMSYFGGSLDEYLAITDASQAGRYFCTKYERGSGEDRRAANAAAAYDWILSFG